MSEYCPVCRVLQERAAEAITRQVALVSKRDIARLRGDFSAIDLLLPQIDAAKADRAQALEEYRAHTARHDRQAARTAR